MAGPTEIASSGELSGAVTLLVVGMVVVFSTLSLIAVVVLAIRAIVGREGSAPEPGPAGAPAGVDPRHLAVITAAATAALGARPRITRVVMLGREAGRPWVTEGRVVVMGSHHLHHR